MSRGVSRAFIVVALGAAAAFGAGCSSESGSGPKSNTGSIGLALQLANGETLSSVSYAITGPSSFSRMGSIDTSKSATLSTLIGGLPAGTGFSVALDGTAMGGSTHCTGVAPFDVVAHATTAVTVRLSCREPSRTGSVFINGTLNVCPVMDGTSASPAEVVVGSSLALAAAARDLDAGPSAMTYHWTATGGTLSAADVANPSLTCTSVGAVMVTVTVTDGDCSDTGMLTVTCTAAGAGFHTMDLSRYHRIARYDLPEPTRTMAPAGSLLAQEASSVTYNWDTDTLFVTGDGGTSVVQVSKTGALINSMSLAPGSSPQGTEFYDTEGISYVGGGKFVLNEERNRQVNLFTYVAGGTLHRADVQTVKLGTTIGNVGLEGVTFDPKTGHFIFVKEKDPQSIFETGIDFVAGTATNGSPTADESVDLFSPALVNTLDLSDVFALSLLPSLTGDPTYDQLLILSQESGKIVQVDRSGSVTHTLTIVADAGDTISVPDMTMEGLTMDRDGFLYVVNENGGGDASHPQLWVFAPSTATNVAPTAVSLTGAVTSLPENTNTMAAVHLADLSIIDDGLGDNTLSLSGADASSFQIIGTALFLKAGTSLNHTTKPSYSISVNVDDTSVGATPDASALYTLAITAAGGGGPINLAVTEVAAWSSGNSPLGADWFEVTNLGTSAVDVAGWTMDDSSGASATSVPMNGISSIAPGESVIFIETAAAADLAAKAQAFVDLWFGGTAPAGLQIGNYFGSGVGLSTGGDGLNLFDTGGTVRASVSFGASPGAAPFATFDNAAGLNNAAIATLSVVGQNGAFVPPGDSSEIGSPGTIAQGATPIVGVTALDGTASETAGDTGVFRFTRSGSTTSAMTIVYSIATGAGQATAGDYTPSLTGSQLIPAGAASVDVTITPVDDATVEGSETLTLTLSDTGSYDVGPNGGATITITDNDVANAAPTAVTLSNTVTAISETADVSSHVRVADLAVTDDGQGTNDLSLSGTDAASFELVGASLYLKAGTALNHNAKPTLAVTVAVDDATVGATPDATVNFTLTVAAAPSALVISEVAPWSSGNSPMAADWFEVTNTGSTAVNVTGWKVDDNSHAFASALALNGVTSIAPGEAVIFIESATPAAAVSAFTSLWLGSSPARVPQVGTYTGSGIGLGTGGDEVVLFDSAGNMMTGVAFGASPGASPFATFDNHAGAGSNTLPLPVISALSATGVNGAYVAPGDASEIGSPGIGNVGRLLITEVSPWSSSGTSYNADWFEVTNVGGSPVTLTGARMDDNSNAFASAVPMVGVTSIAPGQSAVFVEGTSATATTMQAAWFGASPPAGFQIGSYTGSGVGLSTTADAVNVYDSTGKLLANVSFGTATTGRTFDNVAGLATVTALSTAGTNGAFLAPDGIETGSPGTTR
jgi:uncharacterized protein YjiK